MATIRQRGKSWQAQIRRKGHKPITKAFSTKGEAVAWARHIESEMDSGGFLDRTLAELTLLDDVLTRYQVEVLPNKKSQRQIISMSRMVSKHLGAYSLNRLTPMRIAAYRDMRLQSVGPQSVKHELGLISRVMNYAIREWGMFLPHGNPIQFVSKPKLPTGRERRLQPGEEERLRTALSDSPLVGDIVTFALETALRRGEIASMHWDHIASARRVMHIPQTKTDTPRYIPLSSRAMRVLESIPRRLDGEVWGIKPDSISQAFERACKRANITGLRFHDLRHEATSRLFERGLSIMEVASITGHKDLRMLRRYTHLRAEELVDKLG